VGNYNTSENARLALKHRLYVPKESWGLQSALRVAELNPCLFYVNLHYEDGVPVGVILIQHKVHAQKHRNVLGAQVFVRSAYRRRGIATGLLKGFVDPHPRRQRKICANKGAEGSQEFWRTHDVTPWYVPKNQPKEEWNYS
jgi:predicted acetyltransferase